MTNDSAVQPPAGTIPAEQYYEQDERRASSRVLSYGSGWQQAGWSDQSHVIQLYWVDATKELVAFYITYDWGRLNADHVPEESVLQEAGETLEDLGGSGDGVGKLLGELDLATTDVEVRVIAKLDSSLECHELLWNWRWVQHHPDGLSVVMDRIARKHGHDAPADRTT
jgi:hypothetical protein